MMRYPFDSILVSPSLGVSSWNITFLYFRVTPSILISQQPWKNNQLFSSSSSPLHWLWRSSNGLCHGWAWSTSGKEKTNVNSWCTTYKNDNAVFASFTDAAKVPHLADLLFSFTIHTFIFNFLNARCWFDLWSACWRRSCFWRKDDWSSRWELNTAEFSS